MRQIGQRIERAPLTTKASAVRQQRYCWQHAIGFEQPPGTADHLDS
jgi:hypothetical protein